MSAESQAPVSKTTLPKQATAASTAAADMPGAWLDMSPFQQAHAWEKQSPDTYKVVMKLAVRYANHQLAFQWLDRFVSLVAVIALFILSWHYASVGATASGLAVFGSGAVATAGASVGLRWVSTRNHRKKGT